MSVRVGPWNPGKGVPVGVEQRDEMAERALAELLKAGSREWMVATKDTLVIAWDYGDGYVEVFDCQIRRSRNAKVKP